MSAETAASWGLILCFGFVANSGSRSEGIIVEKICVGYKGELFVDILYGVIYAELLVDLNDNENHNFQQFKIILALRLFIEGACIMTIPVVIRQIRRCLLRQIKTGLTEHLTMV